MDLFVVPTISFRLLLYGLLIVGHGRRQLLWVGVAVGTAKRKTSTRDEFFSV
jgi:hypothetical protein